MPKLRRLNGLEVVRILEQHFGFVVIRIRGSHHILRRTVTLLEANGQVREEIQSVNVPVHGSKPLAPGMLKRLYREMLRYFTEEELRQYFYTD